MTTKLTERNGWVADNMRKCWQRRVGGAAQRIYPSEMGGFSISEYETWIPGIYETFDAAVQAFSLSVEELAEVTDRHQGDVPYRPIALSELARNPNPPPSRPCP